MYLSIYLTMYAYIYKHDKYGILTVLLLSFNISNSFIYFAIVFLIKKGKEKKIP